jgi:glutathione peroxidase
LEPQGGALNPGLTRRIRFEALLMLAASLLDAGKPLRASTRQEGFLAMQESVYDFSLPLLNARSTDDASGGALLSLSEFRGQVLLIVNTASFCGFTPQYAGLEKLFRAYKDRGFQVLGFPCNQFGAQEPGAGAQIGAFCEQNYGVTFPMFAKVDVNGPHAHPLYRFLKEKKPGFLGIRHVSWNFTKFLVDRKGNVVARYRPSIKPEDIAPAIEALLNAHS